ncbi:4Fe-4S dicluster domain-containing protein [bacterium]|nr:4Fe-4S dicluster domain-containing protein [bacterium]
MARVSADFIEEVRAGDFNAEDCMNCGVCTAVCPIGLELLPRQLFRYVVVGLEAKVIENTDTIFSCLLCRMCEVNCPAEVRITANVKFLRAYINRKVFKLMRN